jgi:hypothetical protein
MQNHKKPSISHAVLCTIGALCNLIGLLLMILAARGICKVCPVLFTVAVIGMTVGTIGLWAGAVDNWRLYAKRYTEYKYSKSQ